MAVFKCKMCGSDLYPEDGAGVVICDLCGSEQTLPKAADERKTALFNKANAFRMKKRFDEALKLYAEIQAKYPDEADAHWGKLLCEYGIEYVDDNKTERKIPTCNRTLSVSIFDHPEYKAAMKKATAEEGEIYKREATEIDGYQKKILEIAKKEAPYDIFICFKELDSEGKRTKDSQLATKIYENLTKKNYKVFFSRVTLKSKVGSEYEPYIYAALQSAKVMLVLATKKEYVEAVWVRNEWSRYLGFMEADGGKSIVPCIKDIDAYDLPEALQDFQAQDMGELDFIENLTRAIDSKFGRAEHVQSVPAPVVSTENMPTSVGNLIKRARIALEMGDNKKAEAFAEQALNIEPECAEGYFVELMCELGVANEEGLLQKDFLKNPKFVIAKRFAGGEFAVRLLGLEKQHAQLIKKAEEELAYKQAAERERERRFAEEAAEREAEEAKLRAQEEARKQAERAEKERRRKAELAERKERIALLKPIREKIAKARGLLDMGWYHTVGVRSDGTVAATGENNQEQCSVSAWTDIVAVSCGSKHTVGLRSDGTLIATGDKGNNRCRVSAWKKIVAVACGSNHTVGLRADGTVIAVGNDQLGQCSNTKEWRDVAYIFTASEKTLGITKDGKLLCTTEIGVENEPEWQGLVYVAATFGGGVVGLTEDGRILTSPKVDTKLCESLKEIEQPVAALYLNRGCFTRSPALNGVAVTADGKIHAFGVDVEKYREKLCALEKVIGVSVGGVQGFQAAFLLENGKVVAVGDNQREQCSVEDWRLFNALDTLEEERHQNAAEIHIFKEFGKALGERLAEVKEREKLLAAERAAVLGKRGMIATSSWHTVAVKTSGTVVENRSTGRYKKWRDIVRVAAVRNCTVGLTSDGMLMISGDGDWKEQALSWTELQDVQISTDGDFIVGLKKNGTVVAAGNNRYGQCEISSWKDIVCIACGASHTVGVRSDGTVLAVGRNNDSECDVSTWKNIVSVEANFRGTVGLKRDGTLCVTSAMTNRSKFLDIKDAIAVSVDKHGDTALILKLGGKIALLGEIINIDDKKLKWGNYVAIAAASYYGFAVNTEGIVEEFDFGVGESLSAGLAGTQLFENLDDYENESSNRRQRVKQGFCPYCGGEFKGLFGKNCSVCGKKKDY